MMRGDDVYQYVKVTRTVYARDFNHESKLWTFEVAIMDVSEDNALKRASRLLNRMLAAVDVEPLDVERVP